MCKLSMISLCSLDLLFKTSLPPHWPIPCCTKEQGAKSTWQVRGRDAVTSGPCEQLLSVPYPSIRLEICKKHNIEVRKPLVALTGESHHAASKEPSTKEQATESDCHENS